jgi:membrane fusion protein
VVSDENRTPPKGGQSGELFRLEAVQAQQPTWLGEVIVATQGSAKIWALGAGASLAAICAFIFFGHYTQRTTVSGQLVPSAGLIKVYSPESGMIVRSYISDNVHVMKHESLFELSGDRQSVSLGSAQAAVSKQLRERQGAMYADIGDLRTLEHDEARALEVKLSGNIAQIASLDTAIEQQQRRLELAESIERRYQAMASQNLVSQDQYDAKLADAIEQRNQLSMMVRERLSDLQSASDARAQLKQLPLKYGQQRSEKLQSIESAEQDLQQSEARRLYLVEAPAGGTATAVIGAVGQKAEADAPLVSIVPDGTRLVAQFYVPSRTIGFIHEGQSVQLRYDAFPYQKFGHHLGYVSAVSRVALTSVELTGSNLFADSPGGGSSGPLYRVTVALKEQNIQAFGTKAPLQAGMLVNADVLQDTRRLYEWILEPLYTITGKW